MNDYNVLMKKKQTNHTNEINIMRITNIKAQIIKVVGDEIDEGWWQWW